MTDKEILGNLNSIRELLEGYNPSLKDAHPLDLEIHNYSIDWKQLEVEVDHSGDNKKSTVIIPNAKLVCEKFTLGEILNNIIKELSSRSCE